MSCWSSDDLPLLDEIREVFDLLGNLIEVIVEEYKAYKFMSLIA
jgi:hypothetical protein